MAIQRFVRSTALLGAAAAVAALAPLAQATAASAATSQYGFSSNAFGTQVTGNVGGLGAASGRSAYVTLSCTTRGGQNNTNSSAGVNLNALGSTGAISTSLSTSTAGGVYTDTAHANVASISLLGGRITADAVTADASASQGGTSPTAAGTVTLTNLTIDGNARSSNPAANTKINVGSVGVSVTLNARKLSTSGKTALANIDAILITANTGNTLGLPVGATISIGHVNASVGGPVSGMISGNSFGTSLTGAGGTVISGPSFLAYVACTGGGTSPAPGLPGNSGTLGSIASNTVTAGTVTDTATGVDNATTLSADTSSTVANLKIGPLGALLALGPVSVTAHADVTNGTLTKTGTVTIGSLSVLGIPVTGVSGTIAPNTMVPANLLTGALAGATIELNKQIQGVHGLQVEGLVLTLPDGSTLIAGSASAYA